MSAVPQIRIDYPDDDVRRRVSRFLYSRHFPAFRNLDIVVEHGAVTLTGEVQSYYEKQIAMTACQHVAGVLSLVDEIDVCKQVVVGCDTL
jgi:osmotically-inducible protein OsmY